MASASLPQASAAPLALSGKVSLPLHEFLGLVDKARDNGDVVVTPPPVRHLISRVLYTAEAKASWVSLHARFELDVLSADAFCTVPLIPCSCTLLRSTVVYESIGGQASSLSDEASSALSGEAGMIVLMRDMFFFVARPNSPGRFTATLEVQVPYATIHNNSIALGIPLCTRTELTFAVSRTDVAIACDGAVLPTLTRTPTSSCLACLLPPTNTLAVQWQIEEDMSVAARRRGKEPAPVEPVAPRPGRRASLRGAPESIKIPAAAPVEEQPMVVVSQNILVEIGEGMQNVNATLTFSLVATRRDVFLVRLSAALRVLDVSDTNSQIRTWDVISVDEANASRLPTDLPIKADSADVRVLRVRLAFAVDDSFTMRVVGEMELGSTTAEFAVPALRCVDVARERGFIGVGPRTNVELREVSRTGTSISKIDVKELPDRMLDEASARMVFAFKFLATNYVLQMSVTKHGDVDVLVAAVEQCLVTVLVSAEGKRLYYVQMNVRNTERQFLRVTLPNDSLIWSTTVNHEPVKPAADAENRLMIPLTKSGSEPIVVVFAFLDATGPALTGMGTLVVPLPLLDLPVSHFFTVLNLPEQYKYAESTGALREVQIFSQAPYFSTAPVRPAQAYPAAPAPTATNARMRRASIEMSCDSVSDDDCSHNHAQEEAECFQTQRQSLFREKMQDKSSFKKTVRSSAGDTSAGAMPVAIEMPVILRAHTVRFERLFLSLGEAVGPISIAYREQ